MLHFEDEAAEIVVFVDDFTDNDVCGAMYVINGINSWTSRCDLTPGHDPATRHEADFMCADGSTRIRWSGGGNHAGQPLPYRDVTVDTELAKREWSSQI